MMYLENLVYEEGRDYKKYHFMKVTPSDVIRVPLFGALYGDVEVYINGKLAASMSAFNLNCEVVFWARELRSKYNLVTYHLNHKRMPVYWQIIVVNKDEKRE